MTPYFARLLKAWIEKHPTDPQSPMITSGKSTIKGWLKALNPAPYLYLHPHSFRRLWCSVMYYRDIDGGARDGKWVSTYAGHSSEKTTEIYTQRYCLTLPLSDKELCDKLWRAYVEGDDIPISLVRIA
jgi:integrase